MDRAARSRSFVPERGGVQVTIHPLNERFTWTPARAPFRRLTAEQARRWNDDGFFVLEDALDAETVLRARPDGRWFIARAGEITFSVHLVVRSALLRAFCGSALFRDLARDVIGPDVRLYWDQAVYKKPETPADFPWHQDNGYTFVEPQQYLTCWIALTDATEANGCPWVVPGLHRLGTLRHWMTDLGWRCLDDPSGAVAVPVRAGGIVVFSSLTPHRTGPNRTDAVRKAYIVQFAPDGARTVSVQEDGVRCLAPCDHPDRQFAILRDGRPVIAPAAG